MKKLISYFLAPVFLTFSASAKPSLLPSLLVSDKNNPTYYFPEEERYYPLVENPFLENNSSLEDLIREDEIASLGGPREGNFSFNSLGSLAYFKDYHSFLPQSGFSSNSNGSSGGSSLSQSCWAGILGGLLVGSVGGLLSYALFKAAEKQEAKGDKIEARGDRIVGYMILGSTIFVFGCFVYAGCKE